MIARRHIPFARPDENAGTLGDRRGKIPALIVDRIRRGNEGDAVRLAADGAIKIGGFRRRRDATVGVLHDPNKTGEPGRISQLFRDLMQSCFLQAKQRPDVLPFARFPARARTRRNLRAAKAKPACFRRARFWFRAENFRGCRPHKHGSSSADAAGLSRPRHRGNAVPGRARPD